MVTPFHTMSLVHISKTPVTYGGSWGIVWCGAMIMKLRHDIRLRPPFHSEVEYYTASAPLARPEHWWYLGGRCAYEGTYED
jgi:hypothetical protein